MGPIGVHVRGVPLHSNVKSQLKILMQANFSMNVMVKFPYTTNHLHEMLKQVQSRFSRKVMVVIGPVKEKL